MQQSPEFESHLDRLEKTWGSTIVARSEVPKFTGGVFSAGYLANCDSDGKGPDGSFMIGKKTVYPIRALIEWLKDRSTNVKPRRVRR